MGGVTTCPYKTSMLVRIQHDLPKLWSVRIAAIAPPCLGGNPRVRVPYASPVFNALVVHW